jgi:hypothetical protein
MYWTVEGKPLKLDPLLPQQVGQIKELWVRVADSHRYLMRLLMMRVPEEVVKRRRTDLEEEALRRNRPLPQRAWELADWTILLTDAPTSLLSLQEALVLLRERWQMEMLYKLWKQYDRLMNGKRQTGGESSVNCMPSLLVCCYNTGSSSYSPGKMSNAVWSNWHRSSAILPVLSSKLCQAAARSALSFKVSNVVCVPVVK